MFNKMNLDEQLAMNVIVTKVETKTTKYNSMYNLYTLRDTDGTYVDFRDFKNILSDLNSQGDICGKIINAVIKKSDNNGFISFDIITYSLPTNQEELKTLFRQNYISTKEFLQCVEVMKDIIENKIQNPKVKHIVKQIYEKVGLYNDENDLEKSLIIGTSAIKNHHVGFYGNIYHTLEVYHLAMSIKNSLHQKVKSVITDDLIIAGALLHDIGKYYTYQPKEDGSFSHTLPGAVIEHLAYGIYKLGEVDGDEDIKSLIMSIIGSHHGKIEYGAIKPPSTIEAWIVHQADMMSFVQEAYYTNIKDLNEVEFKFLDGKWINPTKVREVFSIE